ncbi:PIN domain-containing protein [Haloferula sp. A504]|uniref:PIN domain-containing protein n=1 Tax=Haloferula sp. A504 TaxID=3373601 RepID=UPI0031CA475A|nr:PIN domain-containing protein [Verrucomicrobiaceae bacterium E54]
MKGDFIACLDACVLCPPALCDILLRLAEHPRLYRPVFSMVILEEVRRTQMTKFKRPYSKEKAACWRAEVMKAFPEALVEGGETLVPVLTNDPKDRHVLATAIKGQAQIIVTANLKHFQERDLAPWDIDAVHPQDYLLTLFEHSPERVTDCLRRIADDRSGNGREITPERVLGALRKTVPLFAEEVAEDLGWELE